MLQFIYREQPVFNSSDFKLSCGVCFYNKLNQMLLLCVIEEMAFFGIAECLRKGVGVIFSKV